MTSSTIRPFFRRKLPAAILPLVLLCVALAWLLLAPQRLIAQSASDADPISADEVNEVARGLWCPLCSGVRLDSCELKACSQMKEMIGIKLAEGQDAATIQAYFVEQYGPQVLGEPPRQGFNWLAWLLPIAALVGGGFFVWRRAQGLVRSDADAAPALSQPVQPAAEVPSEEADYERKLEEELHQYG